LEQPPLEEDRGVANRASLCAKAAGVATAEAQAARTAMARIESFGDGRLFMIDLLGSELG
jgi:hypothetical protein